MSAIIHNFVAHQLTINEQQQLVCIPKTSCFDVGPEIETLAHQINHAFNQKPGKGVGGFVTPEEDDAENGTSFIFEEALKAVLSDTEQFLSFTINACEKLKKCLIDMATVETGYVVFSHYSFLATDYLMVCVLNTKEHIHINQQLELAYSDHLDLAKMQLAVRIDLTQYDTQVENARYISFIKGRMGRKVSDFFMQFVGCNELVDIKQQNKQLLETVDQFLQAEQLDTQEQHQSRQQVQDYYKSKLELGEDIEVAELSGKLPEGEGRSFEAFNSQLESPLEPSFQADKTALKTLAKFSGQGGGVTLSFDRVLYGDRIHYDAASDTMTIRGIPPNLKDQLTRKQNG